MRGEAHRRGVERAFAEAADARSCRIQDTKDLRLWSNRDDAAANAAIAECSVYQDCPHCNGMAQVKTCESMSLEVVRLLQLAACRDEVTRIEVRVAPAVADYLLNKKAARSPSWKTAAP